jgi:acetylornithine deacetylase/succinyl-diaminopimelate desuccinylase-like protein
MLLYNHYDVQPVDPIDHWTSPPFEPSLRDGALYARGAVDDKGEIVARLAAIDALLAVHGELPCGITFAIEGEEEVASPYIAPFVEEHLDLLQCQGAIWEGGGINTEGQPDLVLGYRGILYVQLSAETMTRDAHSGAAHQLPNAAWRLLWALDSLKGPDERVLIPGFYDDVNPPSHLDLTHLDALPDPKDWYRAEHGVREFVRGQAGRDLNRSVFQPTCNVDGLTAGYQGEGNKTVIPAQASAKVDFRLVPDQSPLDVLEKLRAHLDGQGFWDVKAELTGGMMWPSKAAVDDPLVNLTAETAEEVYGLPAVIHPLSGGSTPVYAFAKPLGGPQGDIPIVTAGVGYPGARGHAPDEHMRISDFLTGARHIARILDSFADLG